MNTQRPIVLCILDGVGLGANGPDDGVATARTPTLTRLFATCPWLSLRAHGTAVGLPSDEDMGNSEVGHNAMGAGRVFDQGAKLVNRAIADGSAFTGPVWSGLVASKTLHLLGLLSDGNVHSNVTHLDAIIDAAAADGVRRLRVHVLTDGRDVAAKSALTWVTPLEKKLAALSTGGRDYAIGSGGGRMKITMDRYEADWAMVARGWACHVRGLGRVFPSATEAIETLYAEDPRADDQWLPPFVIDPTGIRDGDSVLLFNFRGDRAIEISRAFEDVAFDKFDRGDRPDVFYAGIMEYDGDLHLPSHYLVAPPVIDGTVGEQMVAARKSTFACSETQKFGHVTYFFNGNRSGKLDDALEDYVCVPSDVVPFEQRPWMKCAEIADACIAAIGSGKFDHVRFNLANGDMVGHSGDLVATRIAMEAVDLQLGRIERAVREAGGVLLVTADHGNADEMWMHEKGKIQRGADGKPKPKTSHTLANVPFIVVDPTGAIGVRRDLDKPGIAQIGATLLELCGVDVPPDYLPSLTTR